MRGEDPNTPSMFGHASLERRVPKDHPLRPIRGIVDAALKELSPGFEAMYSRVDRPSIPPEKLLRAVLLQVFYTIRSERLLMEQLDYNLLFRWFVGLEMDEAVWDATVFSKSRERLLEAEIVQPFFEQVLGLARGKKLLSDERFTVDTTMVEAWAGRRSFKKKGSSDRRAFIPLLRVGFLLPLSLAIGTWAALVAAPAGHELWMSLGFGAAAILLALAAGIAEPEPRAPTMPDRREYRRGRRWLALLGSMAGILLLALALRGFSQPSAGDVPWRFYFSAIAVAVAAFLPLTGGGTRAVAVWEYVALGAVVSVGGLFRFEQLATLPYGVWFDEAQNTLEALRILHEPSYRPVFVEGLSQMPAMPFYYFALFAKPIGGDVFAVRLATTVAGLASLVCVWALGREMFGPRVGILAAAFLAISRWHVNFSRFGMAMIFTTVFVPLVLFLFLASQRRESPRGAVLCGMVLGIGMQFYYSMFAVPVLLGATFLHRLAARRGRLRMATGLFLLTLGATALTYAPVLQYARLHPEGFNERMRTVSIIPADSLGKLIDLFLTPSAKRDEVLDTLSRTTVAHARMFHLVGDSNGRHNLPRAPMLDPVTGLFFAVGLLWCVARAFDPRYGMLLLWFGAMILPGILSLDFEAPQGARTFGVTAVVALMASLPLAAVARAAAERIRDPLRAIVEVGLVSIPLAYGALHAWSTYFDHQLSDPEAWAAYSTPETKIARVVREEGLDADVYVPEDMLGGPTETLILGQPLSARPLRRGRDLPLEWHGRKAIVFFGGQEQETFELLKQLYPSVRLEPFGAPLPGGSQASPILWIARVSPREIEALQAWTTEYAAEGRLPVESRVTEAVWSWSVAPTPAPFTAHVRGVLHVTNDGAHEIVLDTAMPATFTIDGETVLSGSGVREGRMTLARGNHAVELEVEVSRKYGMTQIRWQAPGMTTEEPISASNMYSPAVPTGGLLGEYFNGLSWSDPPVFREIDPELAFYFHQLPLPRPFSIRWSGEVFAKQAGTYELGTKSIDTTVLSIDGKELLVNRSPNEYRHAELFLAAGWHRVDLRYQNTSDYAQVYLYWNPPGGAQELVPTSVLRPPPPQGTGEDEAAGH